MKINNKKIVIALIALAACFSFYWLEYRPSEIIKECTQVSSYFDENEKESIYTNCLRRKGIDV